MYSTISKAVQQVFLNFLLFSTGIRLSHVVIKKAFRKTGSIAFLLESGFISVSRRVRLVFLAHTHTDVSLLTTQNVTSFFGKNFLSRQNKKKTDLGKLNATFIFPNVISKCCIYPMGQEEMELKCQYSYNNHGTVNI